MNPGGIQYDLFAPFYDAVMDKPGETVDFIERLIQKYNPNAKNVLELACGTGNILSGLDNKYIKVGLDNSSKMLAIARKKIPSAEFVHGDMRIFELGRDYDVILCIFDSINHLINISDWEQVFQQAKKHLSTNGVFIFDMNTISKLKKLSQLDSFMQDIDRKKVEIKVTDKDNNVFNWHVNIVQTSKDQNITTHKIDILEASFPINQIEKLVADYLTVREIIDFSGKNATSESERVYFVCQKCIM
jgi:ubiquinone/menaquinone biosynthesis C-methylase UbiE